VSLVLNLHRAEDTSGDVIIAHAGEELRIRVARPRNAEIAFDGPRSFVISRARRKEFDHEDKD